MPPGPHNALTDVAGLSVGHFQRLGRGWQTGTTVVLAPGAVTASLYPGAAGDVPAEARNPGTAAVVVPALELDTTQGVSGLAVDAGHPGCPTTAFSFTGAGNAGGGWTVPGRSGGQDGTLVITLPGAVRLAADAPNGCQGATVTVFLRAA